jgi:hypothetical protein
MIIPLLIIISILIFPIPAISIVIIVAGSLADRHYIQEIDQWRQTVASPVSPIEVKRNSWLQDDK